MTISEVPAPSGGTDLSGRVAAEVRAWMGRRRINGPKIAAQLGTSTTYLYRRLNGETAFDINDLERIAAILDVSVISLLPAQERAEGITLKYSRTLSDELAQVGRAA